MKKIIDYIAEELSEAFEKAGYDRTYGKVTLSNRPDLCEYQCNGAMAGAKAYKKAPFMIAEDVVALLEDSACMEEVEVVKPGFINIRLKKSFVADYLNQMEETDNLGIEKTEHPEMIVLDYGGPNVAKPLHVGHLRSAIIGESVKRISRKMGHEVLGDIHLGDWGYQMGLIITELKERKPELPYFDEAFEGEYPKRLHLQSANWKKSIRQQVVRQKKMRHTGRMHCMRRICYRTGIKDIVRSGIISFVYRYLILRKIMRI